MPDADKIVRLSELFGVTADQLLRDDLDAPAPGRPSAGEPASESGPRRITELDSYDFIIRWQSESRRWAGPPFPPQRRFSFSPSGLTACSLRTCRAHSDFWA